MLLTNDLIDYVTFLKCVYFAHLRLRLTGINLINDVKGKRTLLWLERT